MLLNVKNYYIVLITSSLTNHYFMKLYFHYLHNHSDKSEISRIATRMTLVAFALLSQLFICLLCDLFHTQLFRATYLHNPSTYYISDTSNSLHIAPCIHNQEFHPL